MARRSCASSSLSDQAAPCQSASVFIALPATLLALAELAATAIPIRINYDAPAGCPKQDAFFDAVRARTDRVRKAQGDEPRVDVNVHVSRVDRGFHGEMHEVVNQSETSTRSVDGATCKEVVEALSLTAALSFDPEAHPPEPAEVSARPSKAAAPNAPRPKTPVCPAPPPALSLEIGLSVLGTVVDTSAFASGGALSVMLLRDANASTSSALQLSLLFASTGLPPAPEDHRTRFAAIALDVCPFRHHSGSLEFAPCALAALGVLELSGSRLTQPETVDRAWWSAGVDLQVSWLLGRNFVFEGALAATVPLVRHRYFASSPDHLVAGTPAISPLVRAGLGYRF